MKTVRRKIAFALFSLTALAWYGVGLYYLFSPEIAAYHKQAIGVDWASLAPGVKTIILALMKGTGDALFVGAVAMTFFLLIPFRRSEKWAKWAMLSVGLAIWVPMLIGAIWVYTSTGAASPWQANLIMLIVLLVAFFLSW